MFPRHLESLEVVTVQCTFPSGHGDEGFGAEDTYRP